MSRLVLIRLVSILALLACAGCTDVVADDDDTTAGDDDDTSGDDDSAGDDDTSGDDDSAGDDDTTGDDDSNGDDDTVAVQAPPGSVLCAAGGRVSSAEGITGVVCTSPVELASGQRSTSADGSLIWHPGPITRIAP